MSPGQFGDTTYTKLFVGGLAWETQKETMKKYFEQFGEILEAVVITDKNTGRSKGYGFVTFKEADAARRACVDPTPVIDGRRANCNLASLGVQRSRPSTPQHGFQGGVGVRVGTAFPAASTFPRYAIQQGFPYNAYGYSPCSPNYPYCTGYYSVYEGTTNQYAVYGSGLTETNSNGNTNLYPYVQYGLGFDYFRYPYHQFYYSTIASSGLPQHPFIHTLPPQPGVSLSMPLTGSTFHATIPHHQSHPNSLRPINSI